MSLFKLIPPYLTLLLFSSLQNRFLKKYFTQAIANNENSTDYMASPCIAISLSGGTEEINIE